MYFSLPFYDLCIVIMFLKLNIKLIKDRKVVNGSCVILNENMKTLDYQQVTNQEY